MSLQKYLDDLTNRFLDIGSKAGIPVGIVPLVNDNNLWIQPVYARKREVVQIYIDFYSEPRSTPNPEAAEYMWYHHLNFRQSAATKFVMIWRGLDVWDWNAATQHLWSYEAVSWQMAIDDEKVLSFGLEYKFKQRILELWGLGRL